MMMQGFRSTLALALVFLVALVLANSEALEGLSPTEWAAIQEQIASEGTGERGEFGSEHGLVRTAVLGGDYTDLPAQDNSDGPRFGHSISMDGDWLAVGAPGTIWTSQTFGTAAHGAVFLFQREAGGWSLRQRLFITDSHAGGRCGHAVALRLRTLVFGCPDADADGRPEAHGRAYVWRLNNEGTGFHHLVTLGGISNGRCGSSVAASENYIAIGCPTVADGGQGGTVRIFRVDMDSPPDWSNEGNLSPPNGMTNARFGDAVALNQSFASPVRLVVGAPQRSPSPFVASGGVHVFERSSPGGTPTWTQNQFITSPEPATAAYFGQALALSRTQLVVGAPTDLCTAVGPLRCGRVYRYARSDGSWQHQETGYAINVPGGAVQGPEPGMRFGDAVAIGFENFTAVGAPLTDGIDSQFGSTESEVGLVEMRRHGSGQPSVFVYRGVVRPPPIVPFELAEGRFGTSIDFDIPQRTMAVGYPGAGSALPIGSGGSPRGEVWIYQLPDEIFADRFESIFNATTEDHQ